MMLGAPARMMVAEFIGRRARLGEGIWDTGTWDTGTWDTANWDTATWDTRRELVRRRRVPMRCCRS